jgi:hypothetical protein
MTPIDFPAGVVNTASKKKSSVSWREVNLVRWENQTLKPIKGWQKLNYPAFASKNRAMHRWISNSGVQYTAYLCERHCYVEYNGQMFDITPVGGLASPSNNNQGGFGDLLFSGSTFGTPRNSKSRAVLNTPCFCLDNWGEELRAMTSADGRLLKWNPNTPNAKLEAVAGAPISNRSFCVTPERHVILFGMGGEGSKFGWSDQEDDTNWNFASLTSKAGFYEVEPRSSISAHIVTSSGVLFFTGRGAYVMRYIGLPYVYKYELVAECSSPYSHASLVSTTEGAFWAGIDGFWMFNGVSASPVECSVKDWINNYIDVPNTRYDACVLNCRVQSEFWFFFSSLGQATNDKLVIYDYRNNVWSMGRIGRSCGISQPNDPFPIMSNGYDVFRHETGFDYEGSLEMPWAETHNFNYNSGAQKTTVKQMLPEIVGDTGVIGFVLLKSDDPTKNLETQSALKTVRSNGYVDVRETARDFRLRAVMLKPSDWTLGPILVDSVQRGFK